MTRRINKGRREREAGKRHRRARIGFTDAGGDYTTLKLGSKKMSVLCRTVLHLPVADRRKHNVQKV